MGLSINIKNMVCERCVLVVQQIFEQLDIECSSVTLGHVVLTTDKISQEKLTRLDSVLAGYGFERIDDKKGELLEKIKNLIISIIHHEEHFSLTLNWSAFLSEKLNYDYSYLSSLFSSVSGITLEQYIIRQKVEKVKEYLIYDQLTVKEIAYKLGYSSVAHLSSQFKKVTGMTPSVFRTARPASSRKSLDDIL